PMKKCKGCGNEYRKGAIAFLIVNGELRGARVCQGCANSGVTIVAPKMVVPAARERKSEAEIDTSRMLRGLAKKFRGMAKLCELSREPNTWEAAADIADAWAKQPAARVTS
ncbi:MAG: hypothetical protein ACYDH4_10785, partial [Candidatus Cryosericum sp.]